MSGGKRDWEKKEGVGGGVERKHRAATCNKMGGGWEVGKEEETKENNEIKWREEKKVGRVEEENKRKEEESQATTC